MRGLLERAAPALLAAALAVVYVVLAPRTGDLPAHVFRAELFGREGFTVWNGQWYSGHHTLAYSVLFPPLAWLLGPWLAGAASAVVATALFEPLARARFGTAGARAAGPLFALGAAATVYAGRLTFTLGLAVGVAALLALERGRSTVALVLGAATGLASPVAGLFVALVGLTAALMRVDGSRRRAGRTLITGPGLALAAATLTPIALLAIAFPEGGYQPFVLSSFLPAVGLTLAFALVVPPAERGLRVGALLYAVAVAASFSIATPMGGNAVRLGQVAGAALLAGALLAHRTSTVRRLTGLALVALLVWWQLTPSVRDLSNAVGEPSTEAAYFAPLVGFLSRHASPADRIEIPLTREHWEAAEVARRFPLARGWLRSTDIATNPLFYRGRLDDRAYARWLEEHAVRFVALADAPLDYSARAEAALVAREPPYLRLRQRAGGWRVYEVVPRPAGARPLSGAYLEVTAWRPDGAALKVTRPGPAVVRTSYTPYWSVPGGCVAAAGQWTLVSAPRPVRTRLEIAFSTGRIGRHGRRCSPVSAR